MAKHVICVGANMKWKRWKESRSTAMLYKKKQASSVHCWYYIKSRNSRLWDPLTCTKKKQFLVFVLAIQAAIPSIQSVCGFILALPSVQAATDIYASPPPTIGQVADADYKLRGGLVLPPSHLHSFPLFFFIFFLFFLTFLLWFQWRFWEVGGLRAPLAPLNPPLVLLVLASVRRQFAA